jgi:hypothetical protein
MNTLQLLFPMVDQQVNNILQHRVKSCPHSSVKRYARGWGLRNSTRIVNVIIKTRRQTRLRVNAALLDRKQNAVALTFLSSAGDRTVARLITVAAVRTLRTDAVVTVYHITHCVLMSVYFLSLSFIC